MSGILDSRNQLRASFAACWRSLRTPTQNSLVTSLPRLYLRPFRLIETSLTCTPQPLSFVSNLKVQAADNNPVMAMLASVAGHALPTWYLRVIAIMQRGSHELPALMDGDLLRDLFVP